jgi:hypothetical protein
LKISINIDEIDNQISLLSNVLELRLTDIYIEKFKLKKETINFWQLCKQSEIIDKVLMTTATPYRVFTEFSDKNMKLKLFSTENFQAYNTEFYHRFRDNKFHYNKNNNKDYLKYIETSVKK